jgi:hypothetical protein
MHPKREDVHSAVSKLLISRARVIETVSCRGEKHDRALDLLNSGAFLGTTFGEKFVNAGPVVPILSRHASLLQFRNSSVRQSSCRNY